MTGLRTKKLLHLAKSTGAQAKVRARYTGLHAIPFSVHAGCGGIVCTKNPQASPGLNAFLVILDKRKRPQVSNQQVPVTQWMKHSMGIKHSSVT